MLAVESRPPFELIYILIGWRDEVLYATGALKSKQTTWHSCSRVNPEILLIHAACQSFSISRRRRNKVTSFASAEASHRWLIITVSRMTQTGGSASHLNRPASSLKTLSMGSLPLICFYLYLYCLYIYFLYNFFFLLFFLQQCEPGTFRCSRNCLCSRAWILMRNYTAFKLCKTSCVALFFFSIVISSCWTAVEAAYDLFKEKDPQESS